MVYQLRHAISIFCAVFLIEWDLVWLKLTFIQIFWVKYPIKIKLNLSLIQIAAIAQMSPNISLKLDNVKLCKTQI